MFERKMYNLRAESDGVIFKPRPKKDNIFIHVDWESCPVPKATTIYVKKSFRKTSKPTTVTCATHTTKSDADPCAEYKARHAHKRLYTVLPKYSKIQVLPGITSCRLVKDNKQAIELNSLLINNMPKDGYG